MQLIALKRPHLLPPVRTHLPGRRRVDEGTSTCFCTIERSGIASVSPATYPASPNTFPNRVCPGQEICHDLRAELTVVKTSLEDFVKGRFSFTFTSARSRILPQGWDPLLSQVQGRPVSPPSPSLRADLP